QGCPLSTRIRSGNPQRWNNRRNMAWTSVAGVCCHCSWGGKLGVQEGPRELVGHRQPTGLAAIGALGFLHGIDLPDLMHTGGGSDHRAVGPPFPPWAI